jgi:hypothetical protein
MSYVMFGAETFSEGMKIDVPRGFSLLNWP